MLAKQLTVFIENRSGRLSEVLNVLKENGVNILSLSLADTTEFGLLRLMVDNAAKGKENGEERMNCLADAVCTHNAVAVRGIALCQQGNAECPKNLISHQGKRFLGDGKEKCARNVR